MALTDPWQGTAEALSQGGGTSGKAYLRKGGKHQTEEEAEGRTRAQSSYPLQPMERIHARAGRSVRKVEWERGAMTD